MSWFIGQIRRLWRHYYDETDGVIFVVDSNDHARMADARKEFEGLMGEPALRDAACLIFCNKQDLPNAMSVAEVTDALGLRNISQRDWHVQGSVATDGQGLTEGLDWLSKTMTERGL